MRFRLLPLRMLVIALTLCASAFPVHAQITMVNDTFTGSDNTSLTTHGPDVNLPLANWTIRTNGTIVLSGNALKSTQQDGWSWPPWAAIESNTCDGTIAVDWTPGSGTPYGPRSGLIFRMSDSMNYWFAGYGWQGTALALWKVVNGNPGLVTSTSVPNPLGATHHVEVRLDDSSIELWWDGTRKIQWSDAFNAWSTMHGVEWVVNEDWASTFDNFTVQTPSYQAVSSVVVSPAGSLTGAGTAQFLTATAFNAQGQTIDDALFHWTISDPTRGELRTAGHYAATATIAALTGDVTVTADMLGGPSGSAAITIDATRTMVFDAFTDANNTSLTAHVPTMNAAHATWSVHATQPMSVQGNQLTSAQNDCPYQPVATLDASTSDGIVSADWTPANGLPYGPVGGVIVRATNESNYWFAGYGFQTSKLSLFKAINGSFAQIATMDPGPVVGRSHHIEVRLAGANIELWWDGVRKLLVNDSYLSTATRHGLTWGACADWTSTFDNFAVQLPGLPAPTRVTVSPGTVTLSPGGMQTFTAQALDAANAIIPGTLFHWTVSSGASGQVTSTSYYATSARVYGVTGNVTVSATPVSGATGSASVTVDATTTLLFDTFTGSDNVALPAHAPDIDIVGSAWIVHTTDLIGLLGNCVRTTQQMVSPYYPVALIDASTSEGVVAADWTPAAGLPYGPISAVVGRATDVSNYWFGGYGFQGTQLALWKMVNGTPGLITAGSVPNPLGSTHHIELRFSGQAVQLWWDGVLQLQASDSYNRSATKHGVMWGAGADWLSTFDNFSVQGVPSPTVTQVVVTPSNPSVALGGLQILTAQAFDAQNQIIPNALFHWSIYDPSGAVLVTPNYFSSSALVRAVAHDVTVTATMAWGPSASASIVADASHVLVYDTFTGPDNTLLTSHAPDVNPGAATWRSPTGQPVPILRSAQLVPAAQNNTWQMQSTIETNATDLRVDADWTPASGMQYGPFGGIVFRQRDDQNYWFAGYGWNTYPLALWQVVNGNWGAVAWANVGDPAGTAHHIEVITNGLTIEIWWDGTRKIQYRSAFAADGGKAGFKWYPAFDWQSTWDTFSAVGTARCTNPITPSSITSASSGTSGSVTVSATGNCQWSAESDVSWIAFSGSTTGVGGGSVAYTIASNPTYGWRVGSIVIGGRVLTVVQEPAPAPPCVFGLWPAQGQFSGSGGSGGFDVLTSVTCGWTAATSSSWIHVSTTTGSGMSPVWFTVDSNPTTSPRVGTIYVGGSPNTTMYSIAQSGAGSSAPAPSGNGSNGTCTYTVSPFYLLVGSAGATQDLTITAPAGCGSAISTSEAWLTFSTSSGSGSWQTTVSVAANPGSTDRNEVLQVGGALLTIEQKTYSDDVDFAPLFVQQSGDYSRARFIWTTTPGTGEVVGFARGCDVCPPEPPLVPPTIDAGGGIGGGNPGCEAIPIPGRLSPSRTGCNGGEYTEPGQVPTPTPAECKIVAGNRSNEYAKNQNGMIHFGFMIQSGAPASVINAITSAADEWNLKSSISNQFLDKDQPGMTIQHIAPGERQVSLCAQFDFENGTLSWTSGFEDLAASDPEKAAAIMKHEIGHFFNLDEAGRTNTPPTIMSNTDDTMALNCTEAAKTLLQLTVTDRDAINASTCTAIARKY